MKSFKKLLSLVLALVMCICLAVPVSADEPTFSDVESGTWYTNAVERWSEAELIMGYPDGTFGTDDPITRGQVAVIVSRLLGVEAAGDASFTDVTDTEAYYYEAVLACANAGVINGYPDGSFGPEKSISREAAFKIVMDALLTDAEVEAIDASVLDDFIDVDEVSDWAEQYVAAIVTYGAVNGRPTAEGSTLAPGEDITRAEFATILNRLLAVYVDVNGNVSTYQATDTSAEAEITGAGFVVVHATNDDIKVTYEVKDKDNDGVEETVVVIIKNDETGQEVKEEFAIASTDTEIVLVHGQKDAINKDTMEEDVVTDMTHSFTGKCTNCAAGYTVVESCDVCGVTEHYYDAHPHTFKDGVCECCGMTADAAMKFNLKVSSTCEGETNYVEANVTNDYAATLTVTPGKVSASNVTLSASMQDVASLGGGTKHHEDTFTTGMSGDPELSVWLNEVFEFTTGNIEVTGLGEEMIGYTLEGNQPAEGETAVITATPYDVEDTRDAWAELTSHVVTTTQEVSDSYINVGNGSYMIIGNDKLCFEKGVEDDLKLDNFSDLGAMEDQIRNNVQLITNDAFVTDEYQAKFYFAAGTELAVSNSIATLEDNCTVTVKGLNEEDFAEILPALQGAEDTYTMAKELVTMINNMVGSANGETIYVDFEFEAPVEKATKFYLGVTANNANDSGTTTVDMEVFDDYSLEINLPMNEISSSVVTLEATMSNVGSLGVSGTRTHSQTINTGMTATGDLAFWMSNAATFEDATIVATIDGKTCTYELESDMDADWVTITGTTDTAQARAAWQALTSHVTTSTQDVSDSKIVIANGSYIDTTYEKLMFEAKGDLVLDNFSNISALKQNIKDHVVLVEGEADEVILYVAAGTQLAVSNSVATLDDNCTIKVSGVDIPADVLAKIRTAANESTESLIKSLFNLLNEAVGAVDGQTVYVDITFEKPVVAE